MIGDGLTVILDRFKRGLDCDSSGTHDAQPQVTLDVRHPRIPSAVWMFKMQLHAHGRIFEDQRRRFDQDGLARGELADEYITRGVKQ